MEFTRRQNAMANFLIAKKLQAGMGVSVEGCLAVAMKYSLIKPCIITKENEDFSEVEFTYDIDGEILETKHHGYYKVEDETEIDNKHNSWNNNLVRHATDEEIDIWVLDNIE